MKPIGSPFEALVLVSVLLMSAMAVIWIAVAAPLLVRYDEGEDAIRRAQHQIGLLKQISSHASTSELDISREELERAKPAFLAGADDANALASLQTRLRLLINENGSELAAARALPTKVTNGTRYLGLDVSIVGELKDLHRILTAIEYGEPILFVERARLRLEGSRGSGQVGSSEGGARMRADMSVWGAMWQESASR